MSFLLRNVDGAIMAWNNGDNNAQKTIWFITSYCLFVILISTRICTVYTKGLDKLHFYMKWGKIENKNHPPILLSATLFNLTWNHLSLVLSSNMVILWSLLTSHFSYWDILVNNIKKRKQNRKIKGFWCMYIFYPSLNSSISDRELCCRWNRARIKATTQYRNMYKKRWGFSSTGLFLKFPVFSLLRFLILTGSFLKFFKIFTLVS